MYSYRVLQQWNEWLDTSHLGLSLLQEESDMTEQLQDTYFGKHALLIGVPKQQQILAKTLSPCRTLFSPFQHNEPSNSIVEGDIHRLPFQAASIDFLILPHTLEFVENARQLLAEACRIIKPDGYILIYGFNPHSVWGIKRMLTGKKTIPWNAQFINPGDIKNWLKLAEFELIKHKSLMFKPPFSDEHRFCHCGLIERSLRLCFPKLGGVYALIAKAKVIPLNPIRMKWKQKLSNIALPKAITGQIAQQENIK